MNKISVGFSHVGLGKTGSTYLQRHYFTKLPMRYFSTQVPFDWPSSFKFVSEGNSLWYEDLLGGGDIVARQERQRLYASATGMRLEQWQDATRSFAKVQEGNGPWLLSAEGLCGFSAQINSLHMSLLKLAGVKKVFFVCRQQVNYAKSLWRQILLAEDRFARFVPFETLFGSGDHEGIFDLDWNLYVQAMDAEFGVENVLVLPYELLVADSTSFFRRLNKFFELAENAFIPDPNVLENPSRTDITYRGLTVDGHFPFNHLPQVRRRLHRLAARYPSIFDHILKEHQLRVSDNVLNDLQRHFAAANQRLELRIGGINLKDYGYY